MPPARCEGGYSPKEARILRELMLNRKPVSASAARVPACQAGAPACRLGFAAANAGWASQAAMTRSIVGVSGIVILKIFSISTMLAKQMSAIVGVSP